MIEHCLSSKHLLIWIVSFLCIFFFRISRVQMTMYRSTAWKMWTSVATEVDAKQTDKIFRRRVGLPPRNVCINYSAAAFSANNNTSKKPSTKNDFLIFPLVSKEESLRQFLRKLHQFQYENISKKLRTYLQISTTVEIIR